MALEHPLGLEPKKNSGWQLEREWQGMRAFRRGELMCFTAYSAPSAGGPARHVLYLGQSSHERLPDIEAARILRDFSATGARDTGAPPEPHLHFLRRFELAGGAHAL